MFGRPLSRATPRSCVAQFGPTDNTGRLGAPPCKEPGKDASRRGGGLFPPGAISTTAGAASLKQMRGKGRRRQERPRGWWVCRLFPIGRPVPCHTREGSSPPLRHAPSHSPPWLKTTVSLSSSTDRDLATFSSVQEREGGRCEEGSNVSRTCKYLRAQLLEISRRGFWHGAGRGAALAPPLLVYQRGSMSGREGPQSHRKGIPATACFPSHLSQGSHNLQKASDPFSRSAILFVSLSSTSPIAVFAPCPPHPVTLPACAHVQARWARKQMGPRLRAPPPLRTSRQSGRSTLSATGCCPLAAWDPLPASSSHGASQTRTGT